jgi:error-prone DNA polymerase
MALLDRDGVYGVPRFHMAAKKNGIKAHIGAQISVPKPKAKVPGSKTIYSIPVLAHSRKGYQNLCRLITLMKMRVPKHAKPGECVVTSEELAAHADGPGLFDR